jgi:hypothetical protein
MFLHKERERPAKTEEPNMSRILIAFTLVIALVTSGCSLTAIRPAAPAPIPILTNTFLADLSSPTLLSVYDAIPDGPLKVARRNRILYELTWTIDQSYDTYEQRFVTGQAFVNTFTDLAAIGLDAAGAVTGTAATKALLAVISGGVTGSRAVYQKNFFDGAFRNTIIQQMRASRLAQRGIIESGMATCMAMVACTATGTRYTLEQGLQDVIEYYEAGTIVGALTVISETTSVQTTVARAALRQLRMKQ